MAGYCATSRFVDAIDACSSLQSFLAFLHDVQLQSTGDLMFLRVCSILTRYPTCRFNPEELTQLILERGQQAAAAVKPAKQNSPSVLSPSAWAAAQRRGKAPAAVVPASVPADLRGEDSPMPR